MPVKNVLMPSDASSPLVSLAEGDLFVGRRAGDRQLPLAVDRGRDAADRVELLATSLSVVSWSSPFRSTLIVLVCVCPVLGSLTWMSNEPLTGVIGQPGGIERCGRIVDAVLAGDALIAGEALARGIDLVELEGHRAGERIEIVEKAAQDLVARVDQPGHLSGAQTPAARWCRRTSAC